ncbi:MAG: CopG family transcriptional regulator, partial [Vicinamibacterales bacterium]
MRTTLDIDDDILQAAKELAAMQRSTTGKVISQLARRGLAPPKEKVKIRNGVLLLGPR